jgi:HSP20 family protein
MVGEVLDGVRDVTAGRRFPRVDVVRREGEGYRVFVDLPGVQKDELEVTAMGGEITVAGRRLPDEIPDDADVLRSERGHGSFRRSVRLPADAREDEVRATLEDGVLVIRVPLSQPGDARTVEID